MYKLSRDNQFVCTNLHLKVLLSWVAQTFSVKKMKADTLLVWVIKVPSHNDFRDSEPFF